MTDPSQEDRMLPISFTATLQKSPAKGGWTYVVWPRVPKNSADFGQTT